MRREYSPFRNQLIRARRNTYRMRPDLQLPDRVAWSLAYDAGQRGIWVADLIVACLESWASAWEERLGETERRKFLASIPRRKHEPMPDEEAEAKLRWLRGGEAW